MEPLEHLHKKVRLSVSDAAYWICGINPNDLTMSPEVCSKTPKEYWSQAKSLCWALENTEIKGKLVKDQPGYPESQEYDYYDSYVEFESLKEWLSGNNHRPKFLFDDENSSRPGYLNPKHPRFSHKLAAAIKVWEAMENSKPQRKSYKAQIAKWLESNAHDLELTKADNSISRKAIDEIATVANWDTKGGAPKL